MITDTYSYDADTDDIERILITTLEVKFLFNNILFCLWHEKMWIKDIKWLRSTRNNCSILIVVSKAWNCSLKCQAVRCKVNSKSIAQVNLHKKSLHLTSIRCNNFDRRPELGLHCCGYRGVTSAAIHYRRIELAWIDWGFNLSHNAASVSFAPNKVLSPHFLFVSRNRNSIIDILCDTPPPPFVCSPLPLWMSAAIQTFWFGIRVCVYVG